METRHLFYTLCMIWNHAVPHEYRTHNYKRYSFGPHYTEEYMTQAFRCIARELLKRSDVQATWSAAVSRIETILDTLYGRHQIS